MQNTLPTDLIATALLSHLDAVKASIAERIVSDYNRAAERLAVTRTVRVWNRETKEMESITVSGWGFDWNNRARGWNRTEGDLTRFAAVVHDPSSSNNTVYSNEINAEEVEAAAQAEAESTLLMWHKKLLGKLGAVESCEIVRRGNYTYNITVRKAGVADEIRIEQQIVWKTASRTHTWFAQFPARIYVGGKFTPEAKFKSLVA